MKGRSAATLSLPSPLDLARRILDDFGLTALVGLELEFYLLGGTPETVVRQAQAQLAAQLPLPPRLQPESGRGQYELVLPHRTELADLLSDCRYALEVLEARSRANGTAVSRLSKPFADRPGSGLHVNVCLLDETGRNVFQKAPCDDNRESPTTAHAVNGLLETMVGLMVFFAPTENCYERYRPDNPESRLFSPSNVSWGGDNRSVAIRIPASTSHASARRLEHRVSGASACPESVLAAVLLGIHHGLRVGRPPRLPKLYGIAAHRSDELPAFPRSLAEARAFHRADDVVRRYAECASSAGV
ncbi:hypothetical protein GCM10022251_38130 [Phytohabitans flavus]|uniref:GS catalytic domain-containing protein n=1 Tax=Phytohabitans flavus TaxID=1076124 RepID=A0A6F8XVP3_9ACTN|nr:hypothetical protein Pflav_042790 [Phytohabitans flavus]